VHGALLGLDNEPADSLWIRISGQTNVGEVVVGRVQICISKPGRGKVDEACRQLEERAVDQRRYFISTLVILSTPSPVTTS